MRSRASVLFSGIKKREKEYTDTRFPHPRCTVFHALLKAADNNLTAIILRKLITQLSYNISHINKPVNFTTWQLKVLPRRTAFHAHFKVIYCARTTIPPLFLAYHSQSHYPKSIEISLSPPLEYFLCLLLIDTRVDDEFE